MNEDNSQLAPSAACVSLTKRFEGCKLHAYQDTGGIWTIGYGHTNNVHKGDACTQEQADDWLYEDLDEAWQGVYSVVDVALSQGQCDALTDFTYNLGIGQFRKSTLLRKLNVGDNAGASAEFPKWVYDNGQILPGLVKRREAERELFDS